MQSFKRKSGRTIIQKDIGKMKTYLVIEALAIITQIVTLSLSGDLLIGGLWLTIGLLWFTILLRSFEEK